MSDFKSRPFGPLMSEHPSVGGICKLCGQPLLIGQRPSLVIDVEAYLQPHMLEEKQKMLANKVHNAQAAIVHWTCILLNDLPREKDI
jgi:hypothetical protein